jgi:prophage maintenance system killer protein
VTSISERILGCPEHNVVVGFTRAFAMVTFLGVNGHDFEAEEPEIVGEFLALADGGISEEALADWIRQRSSKRR